METLLQQFGAPEQDEIPLWVALIDALRPDQAQDTEQAATNLAHLTRILKTSVDIRQRLRQALIRLFQERKQVSLYVSSGLLPSTGFFSEIGHRISNRWLPALVDTFYMKDLLGVLFHQRSDERWVNAIPNEIWADFFRTLFTDTGITLRSSAPPPYAVLEIIEALRMLSYHVAALGLDPELVHVDPSLEEHESPFLAQNAELVSFLRHYQAWWTEPHAPPSEDETHLAVLLDQCHEIKERIHRRAARFGTSLALNFKLERLNQHLDRMSRLLNILVALRADRSVAVVIPNIVELFKELVRAECRKNNLADHLRKNIELLSLRVTENAGRTGEHYITSGRDDYFAMLRSAAGAGLIIACMAAFKIVLGRQEFAPLNEIVAICLNYAIGFVVIHMLHFTVATKQPAMTANAIAAAIEEEGDKPRNLSNLADLIVRTLRSQLAAVLGNVGVAVPLAILIGMVIHAGYGHHFVTQAEAKYLLTGVNPFASGAIVYAAIAGICLFLAGLIAGYYDNLCVYNRIPQRLKQVVSLQHLLGRNRLERLACYVENNLGALAGNFAFGFMLGGVWGIGMLLGLPLDIRHIAFSSAHLGYAVVGLDFSPATWMMTLAIVGVAMIGITNLAVSFSLALLVALRARRVTFAQGRELIRLVAKRFLTQPRDFFLPPRSTTDTATRQGR